MRASDFAAESQIEIYPDSAHVLQLFLRLDTQWRCGPAGFYGLDYNVLYHRLDRLGLSEAQYEDIEGDIRTMELAALDEMRKEQP